MKLSTPSYILEIEGERLIKGQFESPPASPVMTTSNLHESHDGIIGQRTTNGFCIYEYRDKLSDKVVDLKHLKLSIPLTKEERVEDRIRVSPLGKLAIVSGRSLHIGHLLDEKPEICLQETILEYEPSKIFWYEESLLSVRVIGEEVEIYNVDLNTVLMTLKEPEPCMTMAFEIDLLHMTCLVLSKIQNDALRFRRYNIPHQVTTSGSSSCYACIKNANEIYNLRLAPSNFSRRSATNEAILSLQDPSLLWEVVSLPTETVGCCRAIATDSANAWIAFAAHTGFYLFSLARTIWMQFAYEEELNDIVVEHLTWLDFASDKDPLLAIVVTRRHSGIREFWILSPKLELGISNLLHRQEAAHKILALSSPGPGLLGILTAEYMLQVITVQQRGDDKIDLSLLMSASVSAFADSCLDKSSWKFYFVHDLHWQEQSINLIIIRRGDLLFTVKVPTPVQHTPEASRKSAAVASIIEPQNVQDFWVWRPADQLWLIVLSNVSMRCYKWPFSDTPNITLERPAKTWVSFYPKIGGALLVFLEQMVKKGWDRSGDYDFVVHKTVSLVPQLLVTQLESLEEQTFTSLLQSILRELASMDEKILIMELFLNSIMSNCSRDRQALLFTKAAKHLLNRLGSQMYRACVANFFRKIELGDASRIQIWLGPIEKLLRVMTANQ